MTSDDVSKLLSLEDKYHVFQEVLLNKVRSSSKSSSLNTLFTWLTLF